MKINSYSFGRIVIDGKEYTNDVIIFPNKVKSWWRRAGHEVCIDDIGEIVAIKPKLLIIGTGASGCLVVKDEVKELLKSKGISLEVRLTEDACSLYNGLKEKRGAVAALHLTC